MLIVRPFLCVSRVSCTTNMAYVVLDNTQGKTDLKENVGGICQSSKSGSKLLSLMK